MKIVVVGSGLAAVGAIRAILKSGHRPIVLDIGSQLPAHLAEYQLTMSIREPNEWSDDEWVKLASNEGVPGRVVPRKLVFGSDYFYSREQADLTSMGDYFDGSPPWSPATGGFSVGWGAAALPPALGDIAGWPIAHEELLRSIHEVLDGIAVSEPDDEIGEVFGRLRPSHTEVLRLSSGQEALLERLGRSRVNESSMKVLVGQSRLLTQAGIAAANRCRYCGHCSSGCVYGSIYTAEQDVNAWAKSGLIEYHRDATVFQVSESANSVRIRYLTAGDSKEIEGDRLFLGAGAVNTSRVLLNSTSENIDTAVLRRTGGALQLFASWRPLDISWPDVNTQASHFMEIQDSRLSPFWAHVQIGQPNELILRRLGVVQQNASRLRGRVIGLAARRLVSAALNVHSSRGPSYEIQVERRSESLPRITTRQHWDADNRKVVGGYAQILARSMRSAGYFRVPFASQDSGAAHGYHFGASFPMQQIPCDPYHTDSLGRPFGWQRIHAIDTSVLPAIPATTVGLLTMANAHRIAKEVLVDRISD